MVILGSRHVQFEVGETQLICRRLEGDFLDYKNAIPRQNPIVLTADKRALMSSIDRVSVVISDKMKSPIRCIFWRRQRKALGPHRQRRRQRQLPHCRKRK